MDYKLPNQHTANSGSGPWRKSKFHSEQKPLRDFQRKVQLGCGCWWLPVTNYECNRLFGQGEQEAWGGLVVQQQAWPGWWGTWLGSAWPGADCHSPWARISAAHPGCLCDSGQRSERVPPTRDHSANIEFIQWTIKWKMMVKGKRRPNKNWELSQHCPFLVSIVFDIPTFWRINELKQLEVRESTSRGMSPS